jgi:hypothetical protein
LFRFAKFHRDSLRFATFHLVSYRFAKFQIVLFRFADIQTVSVHKVNFLIRFLAVMRIRIRNNPKLFNTVDPNPKKFQKEGMEKMKVYVVISVAEPKPQGAASFGRSRSSNAMRLSLRRHRVLEWY